MPRFTTKIDRKVNFLYDNAVIAGSSNGRTWAFEAQYLGSNPSPAVFSSDLIFSVIIPLCIKTFMRLPLRITMH